MGLVFCLTQNRTIHRIRSFCRLRRGVPDDTIRVSCRFTARQHTGGILIKCISIPALLLALVLLLGGCGASDDWRSAESIFSTGETPWVFHMKSGRTGLVDGEGHVIAMLPKEWRPSGSFSEGLLPVQNTETNLYGYINAKGELVIPFKFPHAAAFSEGLAAVKTTTYPTLWGYIDKTGELVIRDDYDHASAFSEGYAVVTVENRDFFIDQNGRKAFGSTFDQAGPFTNGYARVKRYTGTKIEYIDQRGKTCYTFEESWDTRYSAVGGNRTIRVYETGSRGLCGYIRLDGKELTRKRWLNVGSNFSASGYAIIKDPTTSLYGLLEYGYSACDVIVPMQYTNLRGLRIAETLQMIEVSEGEVAWFERDPAMPPDLYYAEKDGKVGVIDMTGRVVIPFEYDKITNVADGRLFAQKGGKWMILDEQGNVLVQ